MSALGVDKAAKKETGHPSRYRVPGRVDEVHNSARLGGRGGNQWERGQRASSQDGRYGGYGGGGVDRRRQRIIYPEAEAISRPNGAARKRASGTTWLHGSTQQQHTTPTWPLRNHTGSKNDRDTRASTQTPPPRPLSHKSPYLFVAAGEWRQRFPLWLCADRSESLLLHILSLSLSLLHSHLRAHRLKALPTCRPCRVPSTFQATSS